MYIGYQATAPKWTRPFVASVLVVVFALALPAAALLAFSQRSVDTGVFEFGKEQTLTGTLYKMPIPMLRTSEDTSSASANIVLVGRGKHGVSALTKFYDGEKLQVKGTLIYRQGMTMLEVGGEDAVKDLGRAPYEEQRGLAEHLGHVRLDGELVDTKCFFGVMRPATGKVHRACAIRCLSGGVPPGLLVHDSDGNGVVVMLAGIGGAALDFNVQLAGLKVRAEGDLEMQDGLPILRTSQLVRE